MPSLWDLGFSLHFAMMHSGMSAFPVEEVVSQWSIALQNIIRFFLEVITGTLLEAITGILLEVVTGTEDYVAPVGLL